MGGLIYTAITDGYDDPRPMLVAEDDVTYWMFYSGSPAKGWEKQNGICGSDPRSKAREIKVNVPVLFPVFDWFLWLDGTMQIQPPALPWIDKLLESGVNFAAFKHNEFSCAYREIDACIDRRKDKKKNLELARKMLEDSDFPRDYGHVATGFLWRRSCPEVRRHAVKWWRAMRATTMRDQCSFGWALRECGLEVEYLPGLHTSNELVHYRRGHAK